MRNETFTQTIEGVAEFLKGVKKTYKVSSEYPKVVNRKDRFCHVSYSSTVKRFSSVGDISYRLNLVPNEDGTKVVLVLSERAYKVELVFRNPEYHKNIMDFKFVFPQKKLMDTWFLEDYVKNPLLAEKLIDDMVHLIVTEDFRELFTGQVYDNKHDYRLEVEGDFYKSYQPDLEEKYVFE